MTVDTSLLEDVNASAFDRAIAEGFVACSCLHREGPRLWARWECACRGVGVVAPMFLSSIAPHVRPVYGDLRRERTLANVLAFLTGEPIEEWRRRKLVWPDVTPDPMRKWGTIYAGWLLRWRIDEPPFHLDSSSSLRETDTAQKAWDRLVTHGMAVGTLPPQCATTREVIRYVVHQTGPSGLPLPRG